MSVFDALDRFITELERAGLPYMVVGSVASSAFGEPRSTRDVDLVVAADPDAVEALVAGLTPDAWYADIGTARTAVRERGQFNVIDQRTMWKIAVIVQKTGPYPEVALARRRSLALGGRMVFVQAPEDIILSKLQWPRRGLSERQLRDVAGVLAMAELDWHYLENWAEELGLTASLLALR